MFPPSTLGHSSPHGGMVEGNEKMRLATANLKPIGKLKLMVVIATTLCQESPRHHPASMPGYCFRRRKWTKEVQAFFLIPR
jgi:hypothetical protein